MFQKPGYDNVTKYDQPVALSSRLNRIPRLKNSNVPIVYDFFSISIPIQGFKA